MTPGTKSVGNVVNQFLGGGGNGRLNEIQGGGGYRLGIPYPLPHAPPRFQGGGDYQYYQ